MAFAFYILIFIFGAMAGSFLNCVIYRVEVGKSFTGGQSFCPKCKHSLNWRDLVPVFSFMFLRGRCRYCGEKISLQYPAVEIATGCLFLISYFLFLNHFLFLDFYLLAAGVCLLAIIYLLELIFIYDLKHYIIPDKFVFSAIGLAVIYQVIGNFSELIITSLAAISAAGFFFLIWAISRGKWMGFGDVKLAFLLGFLLGWPSMLVGLFLAFMLGSVVGLVLIGFGKKTMKSQVPFGPFLIAGAFVAFLWGQKIVGWYLRLTNF